jgi:2-C-methyl-D-erythritol 2,4-cyclodiphosphate synthase
MTDIRIGHGYDVHAFQEGDHLMLGGVRVPHDRAFKAHSDGDVLIHALCDALLGAAALGDIGRHFPDTDPRYAGADSRALLREVRQMLEEGGWLIGNVDCTVIAQAPKLSPHVESMREHLAADLATEASRVNVKATTTERLGFAGREEGIAAHAVVLIERA